MRGWKIQRRITYSSTAPENKAHNPATKIADPLNIKHSFRLIKMRLQCSPMTKKAFKWNAAIAKLISLLSIHEKNPLEVVFISNALDRCHLTWMKWTRIKKNAIFRQAQPIQDIVETDSNCLLQTTQHRRCYHFSLNCVRDHRLLRWKILSNGKKGSRKWTISKLITLVTKRSAALFFGCVIEYDVTIWQLT